jgi:hypothetical protein
MKKNIINIFLLIIALVMVFILGILSFVYSIVSLFFSVSVGRFGEVANYAKEVAISLDILGNEVCAHPFNLILITKDSKYKFGVNPETVSCVLGKNLVDGTLTKLGYVIVVILNKIEKDHCINSIKYY